jgi:predicted aspartyl protease
MIFSTRAFAALSIAVGTLFGATAQADDCGPLTMITSVDLVPTSNNTWQFAPVMIGNARRLMLIDTGGFVSEITPQAVQEFGLAHRQLGFMQVDVTGATSQEAAVIPSFSLGGLSAKSIEFVIAPGRTLFGDNKELVGIIGPNILRKYDVDIDFGAHKLNLMSPDHCEGKVVYWHPAAIAVLPMHVLPSGHIVVSVTLDGKEERALLDTGAMESTLTLPIAEGDFNLKMGKPDTPYVSELNGKPGAAIYKHRFSSLSFGDIAASNPEFVIIPDLVNHPLELQAGTGTRFVDTNARDETAPILLGMNVLRHLHLYIAYKEQKLYITPAGAPPNVAQATDAPGGTAAEK